MRQRFENQNYNLMSPDDIFLSSKKFIEFLSSSEAGYNQLTNLVDILKNIPPPWSSKNGVLKKELTKQNKYKRHSSGYVGTLTGTISNQLGRWNSVSKVKEYISDRKHTGRKAPFSDDDKVKMQFVFFRFELLWGF
jgi:hypothetical protein